MVVQGVLRYVYCLSVAESDKEEKVIIAQFSI